MALNLVARLSLDDRLSGNLNRINSNMNKTENAAKRLTNSVKSFGSSVAKIGGAIGVTAAVAGGFNMIRDSVGSAMSRIDTMEQFDRVMTTLTGSSKKAAAALATTNEAMTGTAYGLDIAAKGVQNFVTRGMEIEKATDMVRIWGDAVAFYGDGSNEQLATVSDALGKMYSNGKIQMDQMNRLMDIGINPIVDYAKVTGRSAEQVQADLTAGRIGAEEFIDTVGKAMMEGTNGVTKIAGAAKDAGATWGSTMANMRAAVTRGVIAIIENIDQMLEESGLPDMRTLVADFGKRFESALKQVASYIPVVVDWLKRMSPYFPLIKDGVIALVAAFLTFRGLMVGMTIVGTVTKLFKALRAGTVAATAAQLGLNTAMLLNPMTWVVAGIAALVAAGVLLYRNWDTVKEKAGELWSSISGFFGNIGSWFAEKWNAAKDATKSAITAMGDWIVDKFNQALSFIVWWFTEMPLVAAEKLSYFIGVVVGWISQLPRKFAEYFGLAKDWAVEKITELPGLISGFLSNAKTRSVEILVGLAASFTEWFTTSRDNAINIVKELPDKIAGFIAQIPSRISGVISTVYSKFKELGAAIPKAIAAGFEAAIGAVGKAAKWAIDKVVGGVGNLRNLGSQVGSSFASGFESGSGATSHFHGLSRVPYDGYFARLHRGEKILTRQEADALDRYSYNDLMGRGSATNNNQTYNNVTNTHSSGSTTTGGIHIAKLADQVIVREEADIDKITFKLAQNLKAAWEAGA